MSEKINLLAQLLLKKDTVEACDVDEIRHLANRYPYFAPAQFLLLEKLKQENTEAYQQQLQKAILYYPDPLEFEYLINTDKFYTEDLPYPSAPATIAAPEGPTPTTSEPVAAHPEEAVVNVPEPAAASAVAIHQAEELDETNLSEVAPGQLPEAQPAQAKTPAIVFEPFHTVDYFASQGIRVQEEEAPKDHLGKQLKSFTEWLRTMKRLPATEPPPTLDQHVEKKVQHMAENSVHETDVVTEAMAEIWIKQGNREKAMEVFKKLCLLNPSKKAYFAAKIDHLKGS